jgi:hypothetical protein
MHLMNILNSIEVSEREKKVASAHFANHKVSFTAVRKFIIGLRKEEKIEKF